MKKHKIFIFLSVVCYFLLFENCTGFAKELNQSDYTNIQYTPWDVASASANINKQPKRRATVMIYMNGSDLESENGAATDDLIEMLDAGVDTEAVNIVLFTGGTNRWQNDVIPANNCMIWRLANDGLEEIAGVGLVNMGNAGTLASFIDFSMKNYPADKYGLILWDHGGGSIAGYGHDEKFDNSSLTLLEMSYAFQQSPLAQNKLEFLGFDSCLMATVEMAVLASDYARYLVASEDLEPGEGWDYSFLATLNDSTPMDGAVLGKAIVNHFMNYYGPDSDEILTLSVIDLSDVRQVMEAMGSLMNRCSTDLLRSKTASFTTLARKRYGTKTFGEGSPRDNECDMVDIGDMARQLYDLFPAEAEKVLAALDNTVVYNRHNSDTDLKGLSAYYIYGGKDYADISLPTYATLNMNNQYTGYLFDFAGILNKGATASRNTRSRSSAHTDSDLPPTEELLKIDLTMWLPVNGEPGRYAMTGLQSSADVDPSRAWTVEEGLLWPKINGQYVCLYEIGVADGQATYAIPAELNGRKCDIIVLFNQRHPYGKILGARQEDGFIIQKGCDQLKDGDELAFYYQERDFGGNEPNRSQNWLKSEIFTVQGELGLDWSFAEGNELYYSLLLTDIWRNEYFTELIQSDITETPAEEAGVSAYLLYNLKIIPIRQRLERSGR